MVNVENADANISMGFKSDDEVFGEIELAAQCKRQYL
jgi:hypothetical protein